MENVQLDSNTPTSKFVFFAMPRLSASLVLGIVDFIIIYLYTYYYGVNSIFVGIAAMSGKLAIAVSQAGMGYLSDTIKSKKLGKRKPFMIVGAPTVAISFMMVLLPPLFLSTPSTDISWFIWILIWDMMFQFFYGVMTTPYQSWVAEQFRVDERPKASAFMNIFNYLSTGGSMIFILLILPNYMDNYKETGELGSFYVLILFIFALLCIIFVYISVIAMPVETAPPIEMEFWDDLKNILKDKNYINVCLLIGIAGLAWSMITGLMLGYINLVLGLNETSDQIMGAGFLALGVVGSLFIWKTIIGKVGKKKTLLMIFIWAIICLPFAAILPLMPFDDFTVPAFTLVLVVSVALGGWYLFPYILYADLAEDYEKTSEEGELKAGLYNGFPSILLNIFQAGGLLLSGIILALPLVPGKEYAWGYLIWAPIASVILIIAAIFLKMKITLDFEWEKTKE